MKIVAVEPIGISEKRGEEIRKLLFQKGHDFVLFHDRVEDAALLIERMQDAEMVIVSNIPLTSQILTKCPKLRFLNVAFTGLDHIDLEYCKKHNIQIRNASGYATEAVSELAVALALDVYRKITILDSEIRKSGVRGTFLGTELKGKTIGIIGTGAIGVRTAQLFNVFGCNVVGWSRSQKQEFINLGFKYLDLDELLKVSDILSLHVPLTDDTYHLIDKEKIKLCKKSAIIINTARGNVVDIEALAEALNLRNIAGAGIDVYEKEPPIPENHPLAKAQNCVLVPHVGYATREAFDNRIDIILNNIDLFE